jgi:uncharacterized protein DUF4019
MKNGVRMGLAVCLLLSPGLKPVCALQSQSAPTAERAAVRSSEDWLALVDSERYTDSWKNAAAAFRSSVTQENGRAR